MTARAVRLRLGAALLSVAAGATAITVAVVLLGSVPGPVGSAPGAPTTIPSTPATSTIPGGSIPTPLSVGFPSPPYGALVFGHEAGSRALGLAILPEGSRSLVRVSLLSGAGPPASGLHVSIAFDGAPARSLPACGPGCYQARLPGAANASTATVTVDGARYALTLAGPGPHADATAIIARATRVWKALTTVVWHERLAATPTDALFTVYRAVAPDELSYTIKGGSDAVIIGGARWDRSGRFGRWIRSVQDPPLVEPQPFWRTPVDAHLLGTGSVGGHRVWVVSFFDPETPGWFEAKVDRQTGRTLELFMTAAAHFMHHVYGPFDAPFRLHPPSA